MGKKKKKILSIILTFAMLAGILPGAALTVQADGDDWTYGTTRTVNETYNNDYKLIKGVYYYPSVVSVEGTDRDLPAVFYYSDGFFENDAYTYSNSLATTSLNMAMAAFYLLHGGTGKDGKYGIKGDSIGQFLLDIGCERDKIYTNNYNKIRPQTDSIGVTMGQKALKKSDGTKTGRILVPVAIRGANYEKEWASNVTLGNENENEGEAKGFSTAAQNVFREIQGYIQNYGLQEAVEKGIVDFWIAGYSRAGATANLTARRLVDTYATNDNGNRVYAYCIEAPQGGWKAAEKSGSKYSCIHSVINKSDLVPRVAPSAMNFKRYGVDHYIPGTNAGTGSGISDNKEYAVNSSEYNALKSSMLNHLKAVNPHINFSDSFQTYGLDTRQLKLALATASTTLIGKIIWAVGFVIQGKGSIIRKGSAKSMDAFLNDFFDKLCTWTSLNRKKYANGSGNQSTIQEAARDYVAVVFDSTPKEMDNFMKAIRKVWDDQVGISDLIGMFYNAFGDWHNLGSTKKNYYINKMIKWLKDGKVYDALNLEKTEKDRLMNKDLPVLVDLLMTYLSKDYHMGLYDTNGMSQLFTFLGNMTNIMSNHYPEVNLAWLRAQDPLYAGETGNVNVRFPERSMATIYLNDEPVVFPHLEAIQIRQKDLLGSKKLEIRMPDNALYSERVRYRFTNMKEGDYRDGGALSQNKLSERIVSLNGTGKYKLMIEQSFHDEDISVSRWFYPLDVLSDAILLHLTSCVNGKIVTKDSEITDKTIRITTEDPAGKVFEKWQIKVVQKNQHGSVVNNYEVRTRDASIDAEGAEWHAGDEVTAVAVFADAKGSGEKDSHLYASEEYDSDAATIIPDASDTEDPGEDASATEISSMSISETDIPESDISETDIPESDIPEIEISPEETVDEEAVFISESGEKPLASDAYTVSAMNITMDQPVTGKPLANKVSSCTLVRTNGSSYSVDPGNVEVDWEPSPLSFWDEDKKEYYYEDASEGTAYTAYLRVTDDSCLKEETMDPDAPIRINGDITGTVSCSVEVLDENGDVAERGYWISVSFPETETASLLFIEEPDDLLFEHEADLEHDLPETLPAVFSDGSTRDISVTWNIDGADWFCYDNENNSWKQMEYYDRNTPQPLWADVIGNAGNETVTAHVYIAGLPNAPMPEASRIEGEYSEPISVELYDEAEQSRIYYTLDGTDPRSSSTARCYEGPITLGDNKDTMDVYLLAYSESPDSTQYDDSNVNVWHYSFIEPDLEKYTVKLSKTQYTYNGKAKKPGVTVKYGSIELKSGTDYSVSYKNNINAGTAKVVIKGKGKYTGSINKTYKIVPKATAISSAKSMKKGNLTVQWKKVTVQTSGYQIQYARNSRFTSGRVSKTLSSNRTVKMIRSGLKSGRKYWVRVRTYKTVNGKKYYSAWSKVKTVTVK